jgi:hypothetical protein
LLSEEASLTNMADYYNAENEMKLVTIIDLKIDALLL